MHDTYEVESARLRGGRFSSPRLGIIGGGQLARMTALAALPLGCEVVVLEKNPLSPGARLAPLSIVGDWEDPDVLRELAERVDVVTLENEFVPAEALRSLEGRRHGLYPTAATLALIQDKLEQKETLTQAGVPVPRFLPVESAEDLREVGRTWGWPLVLKARRNGYDGKGNVTVRSEGETAAAWVRLGGAARALYVEEFWPFAQELAVIITRGRSGETAAYPLVETLQRNHVCHEVRVPAEVTPGTAARAVELAQRAVAAVGAVGSFGVEMFLSTTGEIAVNELAPRVHNSGHYTIEACVCSQFENHVRAVFGWPLGSTRLVRPAAVMLNLLGERDGSGQVQGLPEALAVEGAHVHLYGKAASGIGRKLGHVTALGDSLAEARAIAARAAGTLRFGGTI